mmetsp:Transcript_13907/g.43614  ORF Transcript_13907/g.43614 Transcript_13907/m.43614 type:complete len:881 (-) Transcript_13907:100-2742(-)
MPRIPQANEHGIASGTASRGSRPFCTACGSQHGRSARWSRWQCRPRRGPKAGPAVTSSPRSFEPWTPGPLPLGGKVVLFSQIKECANLIESFVCHYAALGFYRLLLYLDDPHDVSREVLEESGWMDAGFVELTEVNDELRKTWPSMPSWGRVGSFSGMEVQSRQILNNEHALRRAKELGADWILHVDSDELMCLPKPAPAFFAGLSARGCTMYTFNNVEGVPETPDSADVLRTVRTFRQNMGLVPRNPQAGMAFFSWQLRLGGWFISYENGKSAVNIKHAVRCLSVCMWEVEPQLEPGMPKKPDGSSCTWYTNNKTLWEAAVSRRKEGRLHPDEEVPRWDECTGAVLLHFCVCDFASFWRKRWTQLGYLSASDQFRVRATSGAMMSRFYRLQREGRQGEARSLYETMCVCEDQETLATCVGVGVFVRAEPERPAGSAGPSWPTSRRKVRYEELAARAEARGAHFDAWLLYGKAVDAAVDTGGDPLIGKVAKGHAAALAVACRRRAVCAIAAGMAGSAFADTVYALRLGDIAAAPTQVQALEALGRLPDALAAAERGVQAARQPRTAAAQGASATAAVVDELQALVERLRQAAAKVGESPAKDGSLHTTKLPTPSELQQYVARAVRPDAKDSRLYRSLLPVAMGWWHEVGCDEKKFANALGRAAITARRELAALDARVRPRPVKQVRELWDAHERDLKETGVLVGDLEPMVGVWPAAAAACRALLGEQDSVTVTGCHAEDNRLHSLWVVFCALAAEIYRAFSIREITVLSEVRVSRPKPGESAKGPEVDNGGLLPDNRREASFRVFVPADGSEPGPPATLMIRTKDGERALSFPLRAGRIFLWWSRPTFHQVLGGESYFAIACWGVVPQKEDRPSGHWPSP